jgi:hypothetical protein
VPVSDPTMSRRPFAAKKTPTTRRFAAKEDRGGESQVTRRSPISTAALPRLPKGDPARVKEL